MMSSSLMTRCTPFDPPLATALWCERNGAVFATTPGATNAVPSSSRFTSRHRSASAPDTTPPRRPEHLSTRRRRRSTRRHRRSTRRRRRSTRRRRRSTRAIVVRLAPSSSLSTRVVAAAAVRLARHHRSSFDSLRLALGTSSAPSQPPTRPAGDGCSAASRSARGARASGAPSGTTGTTTATRRRARRRRRTTTTAPSKFGIDTIILVFRRSPGATTM